MTEKEDRGFFLFSEKIDWFAINVVVGIIYLILLTLLVQVELIILGVKP
jgi:predicted RND superfamily exporter protein